MAQRLLQERPAADLAVLVVWIPMYPGDAIGAWDPTLLWDPRSSHWWDGDRVVGLRLARDVPPGGLDGDVVWDSFFVYDATARWDDAAPPPVASGFPVVRGRADLTAALARVAGPEP